MRHFRRTTSYILLLLSFCVIMLYMFFSIMGESCNYLIWVMAGLMVVGFGINADEYIKNRDMYDEQYDKLNKEEK